MLTSYDLTSVSTALNVTRDMLLIIMKNDDHKSFADVYCLIKDDLSLYDIEFMEIFARANGAFNIASFLQMKQQFKKHRESVKAINIPKKKFVRNTKTIRDYVNEKYEEQDLIMAFDRYYF